MLILAVHDHVAPRLNLENPVKIKVCDASIEVLNYLVAKIEALPKDRLHLFYGKPAIDRECIGRIDTFRCEFSTNWTQGGPIIEREGITLRVNANLKGHWVAFIDFGGSNTNVKARQRGPAPLIAAMRCYVASKLGDEVEVPDELC